jgi:hypothetical protein
MQSLADAWNKLGLRYGVIHGLECYPQKIGRDVDVLVAPRDFEAMSNAVKAVAIEHGFVHVRCNHSFGLSVYVTKSYDPDATIEIHLVPRLEWTCVGLAPEVGETTSCGPFLLDPWASWVKTHLQPMLVSDARPRPVARCSALILNRRLSALVGANYLKYFPHGLYSYRPHSPRYRARRLKCVLLARHLLTNPKGSVLGCSRFVFRKLRISKSRVTVPIVVAWDPALFASNPEFESFNSKMPIFTDRMNIRLDGRVVYNEQRARWEIISNDLRDKLGSLKPYIAAVALHCKIDPDSIDGRNINSPVDLGIPWRGPAPGIVRIAAANARFLTMESSCWKRKMSVDDGLILANRAVQEMTLRGLFGWLEGSTGK